MESRLARISVLLWLCSFASTTLGYADFGDVRLVGLNLDNVTLPPDQYASYGRVEIYYGDWRSVCHNDWGLNEANVVCRQLGFRRALSALADAYYGEGSGPIAMGNMRCRGYEETLRDCEHDPNFELEPTCNHTEDVGVLCDTTDPIDPCVSSPCFNGTCISFDIGLSKNLLCLCGTGFGGDFCERESVPCDTSPCQNGGTCTNIGDSYNCTCPDGWVSTNCDLVAHPCESDPCKNGAPCEEVAGKPGHFTCSCTDNWGGPTCAYEPGSELYEPRFADAPYDSFWSSVEVWDGTRWRRVCTGHFGEDEAATVCKQLGYVDFSFGTLVTYTDEDLRDPFGDDDDDVTPPLDLQFQCGSYDVKLSDCRTIPIDTVNCGSVDLTCESFSFFTSPYTIILYVVVVYVLGIALGVYLKRRRRRRRLRARVTTVRVRVPVDAATAAEPAAQLTESTPPTDVLYERLE